MDSNALLGVEAKTAMWIGAYGGPVRHPSLILDGKANRMKQQVSLPRPADE